MICDKKNVIFDLDAMEPIWKSMHNDLLAAPVLHVDETPIRCLKSDKTNGYMWVMSRASDGQTLYHWADTRGAGVLDSMLREDMKISGTPYNVTIDNNTAERAVRPVTIGRKNCLFIGAP